MEIHFGKGFTKKESNECRVELVLLKNLASPSVLRLRSRVAREKKEAKLLEEAP